MQVTIRTIIAFGLIFVTLKCYGQTDCRVLKPEISLIYKGECKNGLAHGNGSASGRDNYEGEFRKGYPQGQGIYTWSSGEVYDGAWKKGMRHGNGEYSFFINGKDSVTYGQWVNDVFVGISESNAVKVIMKRNVVRYNAQRKGIGNQVFVKIMMHGVLNTDVEDLMFISNRGSEVQYNQFVGYEQVEFPFWGKVTYRTWNQLKTIQVEVLFEFEIIYPGNWELTIYN